MQEKAQEKHQQKLIITKNLPRTDFILGIDPGLHGGYAVFDCSRGVFKSVGNIPLVTVSMSSNRKTYDVASLYSAIAEIVDEECHNCIFTFAIEKQQAMPKQGVVSMFTTGFGYGVWHGILASFSPPFPKTHQLVTVRASNWQQLLINEDAPDDTKSKSIARIQRLFPTVDLCLGRKRLPLDGVADACNIAHFTYLRMVDQ